MISESRRNNEKMKPLSQKALAEKLSLFVDGMLSESETAELERYIADHPEAARQLREFQRIQQALKLREPLKPDIAFWTRFSAALDRLRAEEQNLLPFPRRFIPYATALGIVSMIAVVVIIYQQRESLLQYLTERTEEVQQVYEGSFMKGAITPLLSNIDKDRVLQFALLGSLPLDAHAQTSLQIDESEEQGYRIGFGRQPEARKPTVTVREFLDEIKPTTSQAELIDSVLRIGQQQLESAVLLAENEAMAIDQQLPRLSRVIVSSIAASLDARRRERFDRLLQQWNSPYAVGSDAPEPVQPQEILGKIPPPPRPERFFIITPETLVVDHVVINLDSLRRAIHHRAEMDHAVTVQMERFAERVRSRVRQRPVVAVGTHPVRISGSGDSFQIEVGIGPDTSSDPEAFFHVVRTRGRKPDAARLEFSSPAGLDTMLPFRLDPFAPQFDSLFMWMMDERGSLRWERSQWDSLVTKMKRLPQARTYGPKLDSLMRAMEQRQGFADSVRRVIEERRRTRETRPPERWEDGSIDER